ncbi:MAG: GAF domain-containing protein [Anaerolineae bacterium]|nr:GAF domain-containing protein [Anaerolineae bacterium]
MNVVNLGFTLISVGFILFILVFLIIRGIPLMRGRQKMGEVNIFEDQSVSDARDEMLLIVRPGGRLIYLDNQVRRLFNLSNAEKPSLERLSRQIRPAEQFLMLGAIEGQVSLTFYGRQMTANSHWIMHQSEPAMLIVIRTGSALLYKNDVESGMTARGWNLRVINEVSSGRIDINDVELVIKNILINLDEFFNADLVELALFDPNLNIFTPYRLGGEPGGEPWLEKLNEVYQFNEGLAGDVAQRRQPVRIDWTDKSQDLNLYVKQANATYHALMGIPLQIDNDLLGVLIFASTLDDSFQEDVFQMAVSAGSMISLLLQDVYVSSQRGSLKNLIEGVSRLTSLLADVNDPKNLYTQLVRHISSLIPVQVLGFLIYNEADHTLEGKVPFQGMPPQFVEVYRVTVLPNLGAEKILLSQQPITTDNASEDATWEEMGMQHLARAASIRDAILQPLVSGGRLLGYLQASNHTDGSTVFSAEETQMIRIAANQSAAMIENATLAQQNRVRSQRSEMLRRISNLVSTVAHSDDLIRMVLSDLNHHLHLDIAAAFILDTKTYRLHLHEPSLISVYNLSERYQSLLVDDAQYLFTVTGSQHSRIYNHLSEDNTLIPFYRQLVADWKAESALVVPMLAGDEPIGEIWLASMRTDYFDQNEVQLANIVATEIAGVIRQERLASQTDASLRERSEQLVKISQIEREMITILDLSPLLETIYDQALQLSMADCGQLCFFSPQDNNPDEELKVQITRGEAFAGRFNDLEMTAIENQSCAYLPDLSLKSEFQTHDGINALIILPIVSQQKTLALLKTKIILITWLRHSKFCWRTQRLPSKMRCIMMPLAGDWIFRMKNWI